MGATEPITLTDPDGAVTRVAPWSSWTREQVRAPGGEPALVTRLDQGQLWFSAGRRRSPWRHEVHVGPAVVSTPRGRFHAIAEADGGATIACLAGRTRVVAGLREPVLLGPDQSAAVSSDGRTLVVMDRVSGAELDDAAVIDLTEDAELDEVEVAEVAEVAELAAVGTASVSTSGSGGHLPTMPGFDERPPSPEGAPEPLPYHESTSPARLGWIPELVAVAAILGLLVAGVWVFSRGNDSSQVASGPVTTLPIATTAPPAPSTTAKPTTTRPVATTATPTTQPVSTTIKPPSATGATAMGELASCRRTQGGVLATVTVTHRSGPASAFNVSVVLVDPAGQEFARGAAKTAVVPPGGTGTAEVEVPVTGTASGSCELLEVTAA